MHHIIIWCRILIFANLNITVFYYIIDWCAVWLNAKVKITVVISRTNARTFIDSLNCDVTRAELRGHIWHNVPDLKSLVDGYVSDLLKKQILRQKSVHILNNNPCNHKMIKNLAQIQVYIHRSCFQLLTIDFHLSRAFIQSELLGN